MARFGLLAQRGGVWDGAQLTTETWFDEAWTAIAQNPEYGLLWWLLGEGRRDGSKGPQDWVAALGAQDQKIYVVPSLDLVVARQGLAAEKVTEAGSSFDVTLGAAIMRARA